jgi:hypothetical protein
LTGQVGVRRIQGHALSIQNPQMIIQAPSLKAER